jgi:hypothetical protein
MRRSTLAILVAVGIMVPGLASGQTTKPEVRGTVGVVRQGGIFGDDSPKGSRNTALTVGVETRRAPDERAGLAFDVVFPTREIVNPHIDEQLRNVYLLVGGEFGRRTFLRLVGGTALGLWSGSDAESALTFQPAAGFAVGRHIDAGAVRATPELVGRAAFTTGAASWALGVQLAVGRRR